MLEDVSATEDQEPSDRDPAGDGERADVGNFPAPDEVRAWLKERVRPERLAHIERVAETAVRLAERWGADVRAASLAALLHDAARDMPLDALRAYVETHAVPVTPIEMEVPVLLHAPVGAHLARHELGVTHPDVLAAIRNHTVGRPGMGLLERIILLADYTEPGRDFPGVVEVRAWLDDDLSVALRLAFDQMILFNVERKRLIPPETVAARNELYRGDGND